MENEIIKATRDFAELNDIPFTKMTENMILNAMREIKSAIKNELEILILNNEDDLDRGRGVAILKEFINEKL